MQYLFRNWKVLEKKLLRAKHIFLCADFDGTLSPFKPKPEQVVLHKKIRQLLRRICVFKSFTVGIISGRALKDVQKKIGVKGVIFVGNHGLEINYKKKNFIHPGAKKYISTFSEIAQKLRRQLPAFPGAILEQKRFGLSLHYRLVKNKNLAGLKRIFLRLIRPYLTKRKIKLTYGKKVWEIRPPIEWDKGKAVLWLVKKLGKKNMLTVYAGDDLTDEDAFRAVNKIRGISIAVGRKTSSLAKYYLKDTKDTERLLRRIQETKI